MSSEDKALIEAERLISMLKKGGVDENDIEMLENLIYNTAWMKIKLDETRIQINSSIVAIKYDNGGGQTGVRENPLFKGYESLLKSYTSSLKLILDRLPEKSNDTKQTELAKPKTMLELVRDKHRKEA